MQVLVLNSGSSSLKFRFLHAASGERVEPSSDGGGTVTGIGGEGSLRLTGEGATTSVSLGPLSDHGAAASAILQRFSGRRIDAVGHRVVHGGSRFVKPTRLDEAVIEDIDRLSDLAPLHNPPCVSVIRAARAYLGPGVPMVAVFDTAFHGAMPETGSLYALPRDLAVRHQIRRYGFHGIAHQSLMEGYGAFTGKPLEQCRLITLHLGNGCSAAAIRGGRSVDTSMGLTPLEGLVMGTRSGDLDPAVVGYIMRREHVDVHTVDRWLNERSGLLGLSGRSNDVRELTAAERDDRQAALALDLFCYRVRKYMGAYLAVLGGADAVVFGGGIGEHSAALRQRICAGMEWCGLELDQSLNGTTVNLPAGRAAQISAGHARLHVFVVAVDEETAIARQTVHCLTTENN